MPASAHRPIARRLAGQVPPAALLLLGLVVRSPIPALQVALLFALLATLAVAADRLAGWLLPADRGVERAVDAGVIAVALAVLPATLLGHFGALSETAFCAAIAGLALLVSCLPSRRRHDAAHDAARAPCDADAPFRSNATGARPRAERAIAAFALAAVALILAHSLWAYRYVPPGSTNYDDLSYHLSAAALIRQTHDLRTLKFACGDMSTTYYPLGGELVDWILLAPFGGLDILARFAQLPFALGCLAAIAALARQLGLTPAGAALAVLLTVTVPRLFPELALSAGNDLSTAFFALAGALLALALGRHPTPERAAVLGLSLGLLVGTKYLGLPFAATVAVLAAVALWAGPDPMHGGSAGGSKLRQAPRLAALIGIGFSFLALSGGYTYLRNWVALGNPIFPQPLSVLGWTVFPGWPEASLASRQDWSEAAISPAAFLWSRTDLFGVWCRWTLLPAALLAPGLALVGWTTRGVGAPVGSRDRWLLVTTLSLPAVLFGEFLFLTHDHRDLRYLAAGVAFASVALAWCLERLPSVPALATEAALALLIAGEVMLSRSEAAVGLVTVALAAGAGLASSRDWRFDPRRTLPLAGGVAVAVGAVAVLGTGDFFARYASERAASPLFAAAAAIERDTGGRLTTVAYVGANQPYELFGSHLRNRVEIVPTAGPAIQRHYSWAGDDATPFGPGRWRVWEANLEELGVEYVAVVRGACEKPERRWVVTHPERFEQLGSVEETELWRVRRAATGAAPAVGETR